jgi:hypothetical protein
MPWLASTRSAISPDPLRRAARADHGRQPVLAGDDRGVRHDPARIEDGGGQFSEHGRPTRRAEGRDEDLALLEFAEPVGRQDDTC